VGLAIFGVRLGQACAQLIHAWVKFSRVAQRRFLTAPSVCRRPNCPLTCRAKQRMGRIVRGSDCHSQSLDPLLKGQTERFGCGRTTEPCGESLQCRMQCRSECHSVQLRGGTIVKAPCCCIQCGESCVHCTLYVQQITSMLVQSAQGYQ
jgi:hypothetical protein